MSDELTPNEQHRRAVLAELTPPGARRRLKMEPIADDDNVLAQLVAAVGRIESGVSNMRDGFDALLEAAIDDEPITLTADERAAIDALRVAAHSAPFSIGAGVPVRPSDLEIAIRLVDRLMVRA